MIFNMSISYFHKFSFHYYSEDYLFRAASYILIDRHIKTRNWRGNNVCVNWRANSVCLCACVWFFFGCSVV
jgi:hypothetical protein